MLIAGNWKMHMRLEEALAFARDLTQVLPELPAVEIAVCPPAPLLEPLGRAFAETRVQLGAQNMHHAPQGAYTGEVSAAILLSVGCKYVILGHSERRHIFGEQDDDVALKVQAALSGGLSPILCVGETIDQRRAKRWREVLERQVRIGLSGVTTRHDPRRITVAYEPVWAIGTGETATPELAQEAHAYVRELLALRLGVETARDTRILYGGSVKPANAAGLLAMPDIDGALVGGASLNPADFAAIIRAAAC
jgi:triosephosphate isomerase